MSKNFFELASISKNRVNFVFLSCYCIYQYFSCKDIPYPRELPSASIIIPFYDEWPSILLRTIYSIVNRTPSRLLKEIILVDDASELSEYLPA